MAASRIDLLKQILAPWYVRGVAIVLAIPTSIQGYDALCNQFGLPKIPAAAVMIFAVFPWWGWLLLLQAVFVYALFEYVRRAVSPPNAGASALGDPDLQDQIGSLSKSVDDHAGALTTLATRLGEVQGGLGAKFDHLNEDARELGRKLSIVTTQFEGLYATVHEHRDRALHSLHAIRLKDHLEMLEAEIVRDAADLYDRLRSGEVYDLEKWNQWENIHSHWERQLAEWLGTASFFAIDVARRTRTVDDAKYSAAWTTQDSQFPNAEAVRRFKKFRIIHTQWEVVVPDVMSGVGRVAFDGASELEVRNGQLPG